MTRPTNKDLLIHNWNMEVGIQTVHAAVRGDRSDHPPIETKVRMTIASRKEKRRVPKTLLTSQKIK